MGISKQEIKAENRDKKVGDLAAEMQIKDNKVGIRQHNKKVRNSDQNKKKTQS